MEKRVQKIAFFAIVAIILVIIAVLMTSLARKENPNPQDTLLVRKTIRGFTRSKDLDERLNYVTDNPAAQRDIREFPFVPFRGRTINKETIVVSEFLVSETRGKSVVAVQDLTYTTTEDDKVHHFKTTFRLTKNKRWLIAGFKIQVVE